MTTKLKGVFSTLSDAAPCDIPGQPREPIFEGDYSFNIGHVPKMSVEDYLFFASAVTISILIGIFLSWRHRKQLAYDMYVLAGRSMSVLPVALSMTTNYISALSLMITPETIYRYSTMYTWDVLPLIITGILTTTLYVPTFYQLKLTTTFEYLERRFSKRVRLLGASFFLFETILYMAFVLYAPGLAANSVTGFNMVVSILTVSLCCALTVITGGVSAVIWTDTFQGGVIYCGMAAVIVQSIFTVGNLSSVWQSLERSGRLDFTDFRLDPMSDHTIWGYLTGSTILWMSHYGSNQLTVERIQTCRSLKTAKLASWLTTPLLVIIHLSLVLMGMFISAFYENCDPEKAGFVKDGNQLAMVYVMDIFKNNALSGVYLAVLFCAAISTFDSCLNATAHVIFEDFMRPRSKTHIREGKGRLIMRWISIIVLGVTLEITYLISRGDSFLQDNYIFNGPFAVSVMTTFALGLFSPHINTVGAITGMICSVALGIFLNSQQVNKYNYGRAPVCVSNCNITALSNVTQARFNDYVPDPPVNPDDFSVLGRLSFWYVPPISAAVQVFVAFTASFVTDFKDPQDLDPKLIVPVFDVLFPFCYLPERFREKLRFGLTHSGKWQLAELAFKVSQAEDDSGVSTGILPGLPPLYQKTSSIAEQESVGKESFGKPLGTSEPSSMGSVV